MLDERDYPQFQHERRVEADLVDPVDDAPRGVGYSRALEWIDANDDEIACIRPKVQRRECRIARVSAIPKEVPTDLDSLVGLWEAGRGEQHVSRKLGVPEHTTQSGAHVRCANEDAR